MARVKCVEGMMMRNVVNLDVHTRSDVRSKKEDTGVTLFATLDWSDQIFVRVPSVPHSRLINLPIRGPVQHVGPIPIPSQSLLPLYLPRG